MDDGSKEELRVYSIVTQLEDRKYNEEELKEIFGFDCSLNKTRLYKYIHMDSQGYVNREFSILKGELVTGNEVKGRKPILRGKYRITAVIDNVPFVYVEVEK